VNDPMPNEIQPVRGNVGAYPSMYQKKDRLGVKCSLLSRFYTIESIGLTGSMVKVQKKVNYGWSE
jgi:hypothetical protein